MTHWITWLSVNWILVVVPLLVFLAIYAIGVWARIILLRLLGNINNWQRWGATK